MKSKQNPALRDITQNFGASRQVITIERPWQGCWRVCTNGKPVADWSSEQSAISHAKRLGWRGNGSPSAGPAPLLGNEKPPVYRASAFVRLAGNESIGLATGPVMRFT
jgi:hypothetical protein